MTTLVCVRCGGNVGTLITCSSCNEVLCDECWPDRGCKVCPVCRQNEDGKPFADPMIEPEIIERAKITNKVMKDLGVGERIFVFSLIKVIQSLSGVISVAAGYGPIKDGKVEEKAKKVIAHLLAARIQLEDAIQEFVKQ